MEDWDLVENFKAMIFFLMYLNLFRLRYINLKSRYINLLNFFLSSQGFRGG